jgi:hypothetical protein
MPAEACTQDNTTLAKNLNQSSQPTVVWSKKLGLGDNVSFTIIRQVDDNGYAMVEFIKDSFPSEWISVTL